MVDNMRKNGNIISREDLIVVSLNFLHAEKA
jgi:hypothetical protein